MSRPLDEAARRDWLRLARTENVGSVAFTDLIQRFGGATEALAALPELAKRGGRAAPLKVPSIAEADRELAAGEAIGARLIASCEPDFPFLLGALDHPPPLLWALGRAELLVPRAVAIVGARIASAAGQRFARQLASELGAAGYVVVSGMAKGVDGAAHEGALEAGTVAVLGGGIDDVYPRDHRDLYERLMIRGCIVSEAPMGHTAQARDFPRRNRIISGLSLGVVVVEAEMRSGSLITARLAGEQGREVFAVPGSPLDPRSAGCNALLKQGAIVCTEADDVIRALGEMRGFHDPGPARYQPGPMDEAASDDLRERVAALLSHTPVSRDELARAAKAPPGAVNAALIELALAGRAELLTGAMVSAA